MFNPDEFKPLNAADVLQAKATFPRSEGIYGVFFDSGQLLLERSGYLEFDGRFPYAADGYDLLYVGASLDDVAYRATQHLTGNSRTSTLRMTVGAILATELSLDPVGDGSRTYYDFGDGEQRLSNWLVAHTQVAIHRCPDPFTVERDLIERVPLPLNISARKRHPFSRYLMTLRAYYARRPRAARMRL